MGGDKLSTAMSFTDQNEKENHNAVYTLDNSIEQAEVNNTKVVNLVCSYIATDAIGALLL